jgi:hypothetical protein
MPGLFIEEFVGCKCILYAYIIRPTKKKHVIVKFQVLTMASTKLTVLWDVLRCVVLQKLTIVSEVLTASLMMEAVSISETLVNMAQHPRRH